jgi:hypothetical protein
MSKKILKAEYKGEVVIGDSVIPCAVLEDGTRVISENGIYNNLGVPGGGVRKLKKQMEKDKGTPIPIFLASKALEPFIDNVFEVRHLTPIKYMSNDNIMVGYPADILPKVCDVWLMARENKTLQTSQLPKAQKAEILMRGLAHIGITALVDEATGYQYERDKNELQKILTAYVTDEVAKWQLTFTQDFYKEICRLWKQPKNLIISGKRPAFFGTLTNKYVYQPIKDGVVLDELKKKANDNNKKARLHQYLSEDVGREHLKRQIIEVTTLMSICPTKKQFIEVFKKKYQKDYQSSMFGDVSAIVNNKQQEQSIPKELDLIVKTVVSHKINPDAPLPNNTFR